MTRWQIGRTFTCREWPAHALNFVAISCITVGALSDLTPGVALASVFPLLCASMTLMSSTYLPRTSLSTHAFVYSVLLVPLTSAVLIWSLMLAAVPTDSHGVVTSAVLRQYLLLALSYGVLVAHPLACVGTGLFKIDSVRKRLMQVLGYVALYAASPILVVVAIRAALSLGARMPSQGDLAIVTSLSTVGPGVVVLVGLFDAPRVDAWQIVGPSLAYCFVTALVNLVFVTLGHAAVVFCSREHGVARRAVNRDASLATIGGWGVVCAIALQGELYLVATVMIVVLVGSSWFVLRKSSHWYEPPTGISFAGIGSSTRERVRRRRVTVTVASVLLVGAMGLSTVTTLMASQAMWRVQRMWVHLIEQDGLVGWIDGSGEVIVEPRFQSVGEFSEGIAYVRENYWLGYVDKFGERVARASEDWWSHGEFHDGLARVSSAHGAGFVDTAGRLVLPTEGSGDSGTAPGDFAEGVAPVWKAALPRSEFEEGGAWGYVDTSGDFVIQPRFVAARSFSGGLAAVAIETMALETRWGFIDRSGALAIDYQFEDVGRFSEGLSAVLYEDKWGYISRTGLVIPFQYDWAQEFAFGRAVVNVAGKDGIIDALGHWIRRPGDLDVVFSYSDGVARAESANQVEFLDLAGNELLRAEYEQAGDFHHGLARVVSHGQSEYIDKTGRVVWRQRQIDSAEPIGPR